MKPPLRVPLAALVVLAAAGGALLLLVPLLSQQSYSRSRSLAEGMRRGLRFSGGILAGARTPELAELLRSQALAQPRRGRGGRGAPPGLPDTRVSNDILPPDGASAGEPKTEAEPYLAADPEDPNRLLAFYQEDRFPSVGGARALTFALSTDGGPIRGSLSGPRTPSTAPAWPSTTRTPRGASTSRPPGTAARPGPTRCRCTPSRWMRSTTRTRSP